MECLSGKPRGLSAIALHQDHAALTLLISVDVIYKCSVYYGYKIKDW